MTPRQGPAFVAGVPVKRFRGVGPVTAAKMERLGIVTGADLRACSLAFLHAHFGSAGDYYHRAARGEDDRPVRADRPYKSVGAERTFDADLSEEADLVAELARVCGYAWARVERAAVCGRTVTLKVKYQDFRIVTRAHSLGAAVEGREQFLAIGTALLRGLFPVEKGIRLLGLTLSGLDAPPDGAAPQLGLPI